MARLHPEELDLAILQARNIERTCPAGFTHRDQIVLDLADKIEALQAELAFVRRLLLEITNAKEEERRQRQAAEQDARLLAQIVQKVIDGGYTMFNLDRAHVEAARRSLARPTEERE